MPKLGETKTNYELGKKRRCHYQWYACPDCGKESWKQLRYGKVDAPRCNSCSHMGKNSSIWKGGKMRHGGYILVRVYPNDFFFPMTASNGYVSEHRLIMAKHLNRCLLTWEIVHHKNGTTGDNRIVNLELISGTYRHNAITRMAKHIEKLEKQIALLEAENLALKSH